MEKKDEKNIIETNDDMKVLNVTEDLAVIKYPDQEEVWEAASHKEYMFF